MRIYQEKIEELIKRIDNLKEVIENLVKPPEHIILDDVDLCNFLKVSRRTSAYWRGRGEITYSKVGGRVYYRLSDVLALMKKCEVSAIKPRF